MKKFITVFTDRGDRYPKYLNVDHIVSFGKGNGSTELPSIIIMSKGDNILAYHTVEEIHAKIIEP